MPYGIPMSHMTQSSNTVFKDLLDSQYIWPCNYLFKFIVKKEDVLKVTSKFDDGLIAFKESSGGKYVSVSITVFMDSSDCIIAKYEEMAKVPGVIAL